MATMQNPSKRPRLSLQIKTTISPAVRTKGYTVDPKDPTTFNTLSNAYVTAIERSTPVTAINTLNSFSLQSPIEHKDPKQRVATPYVASYPETPLTAHATSPRQMEISFPSTMTATPPLSAGPADANSAQVFTFSAIDTAVKPSVYSLTSPIEARSPRRRVAPIQISSIAAQPPYIHPRSLHSILRNSPLPPRTAIAPASPRRQSLRLQEKAAKRVGYNNPLTQDIITNKYIKSHIDLLTEEASPSSPSDPTETDAMIDLAAAFAPNEIQDGGQTPGPFDDVQRRIMAQSSSLPASPAGIRKRKRREKKRRWVWTIGQEDEVDEDEMGGALAALRTEANRAKRIDDGDVTTPMAPIPQITYTETPTPSIESTDSGAESFDVDMSDASSFTSEERCLTPSDADLDMKTPTASNRSSPMLDVLHSNRDTPIPSGKRTPKRDTPIPPE